MDEGCQFVRFGLVCRGEKNTLTTGSFLVKKKRFTLGVAFLSPRISKITEALPENFMRVAERWRHNKEVNV